VKAGGKVAILHFKQAESCILRVKGFREVIDAHNAKGGSKIQMVTELEGGGAKDIGYKAAQDALQAFPDLRGIFAINDPSALGARGAVEKAGKEAQVIIVGFDGQPEGKQAIKAGKIYADPIQFPGQNGRRDRALDRQIHGRRRSAAAGADSDEALSQGGCGEGSGTEMTSSP
jgi:ribose transport system substrate-binding protein